MKYWVRSAGVLLFMLAGITGIRSQEKGDYMFGINYVASFDNNSEDYGHTGLSVKGQYYFLDLIRAQPSLTYFFRKDFIGPVDLSVDAHALIHLNERVALYPLAGGGLMVSEIPEREDKNVVTVSAFVNLGGGIDCWLGSNLLGNVEFKVKNIYRETWFHAAIGIAYLF
jgi:outer membrane protein X